MGKACAISWHAFSSMVYKLFKLTMCFWCPQRSLFMEDTHGGAGGVGAAEHAEEEFSIGIVIVPIPDRKTEEEIAADWDEIENQEDVTDICAQVDCRLTIPQKIAIYFQHVSSVEDSSELGP